MYHFLLLTACTAIVFGFILDTFIIIDPFTMSGASHVHTTDVWGELFLTILFLLILFNAYVYKLKGGVIETGKGENDFDASKDRLSIGVDGMTCSHCKESVESAVYSCGGVENASVNHKTGEVMVSGSGLNEDEIREKIKRKGFSLN